MKRRIFYSLSTVFLISFVSAHAQDPRERYGTYFGGSKADCVDNSANFACNGALSSTSPATTHVTASAVDAAGNIYIAGDTDATDLPTTSGAYSRTVARKIAGYDGPSLSSDTFVAKFGPSGNLKWSTYLGVPPAGPIEAIAADSSGNVTVVGTRFIDADCRCSSGTTPPFILKLNSTGTTRTYYNEVFGPQPCADGPGNVVSPLTGAAIDSTGHVFLTGQNYPYVYSFSTPPIQCLPPPTTGANQSGSAYVAEVNTAQTTNNGRVYIALLADVPNGLAADSTGHAYVAGKSVTKFSTIGAVLFAKNYFPSFATGTGNAITVSTSGADIFFTGNASPQGAFPSTTSFGTITSGSDAFVAHLNSTGGLVYSDVIHDAHMVPIAIRRDSGNEAFVTGRNSGYQYSVNRYSTAPTQGAFLLRTNSTGTKLWLDSTFGGHAGLGLTVDSAWNAFVVGTSKSGEYFPITTSPYPAYQSSFKGAAYQGFLAKLIIEADLAVQPLQASPNPVTHGSNLTYTISVYNNGPDVSDRDVLTDVLPAGTTFVSYSTTNGSCKTPAVGSTGTVTCSRNISTPLNKGSYWGPVKLTVRVNAAAGTTLPANKVTVTAATQDVRPSNNTATISTVKVQ